MLHAIELETEISADGKLPDAFHEAFGRRARIIVLFPERETSQENGNADDLMVFSGTIDWPVRDPVEWQRSQRSEWNE